MLGEYAGSTGSGKSMFYADPQTGALKRVGGAAVRDGLIHVEPCQSCTDHPHSYYRHGYQD